VTIEQYLAAHPEALGMVQGGIHNLAWPSMRSVRLIACEHAAILEVDGHLYGLPSLEVEAPASPRGGRVQMSGRGF
jgi:hypothetical protein